MVTCSAAYSIVVQSATERHGAVAVENKCWSMSTTVLVDSEEFGVQEQAQTFGVPTCNLNWICNRSTQHKSSVRISLMTYVQRL